MANIICHGSCLRSTYMAHPIIMDDVVYHGYSLCTLSWHSKPSGTYVPILFWLVVDLPIDVWMVVICWPAALVDLPPLATLPSSATNLFGVSQTGGARYSPPSSGPHTDITPHDAPTGDPSVGARPILANLCRLFYRNDPLMWNWGSCWRLFRTVEDRSRLPEGIYMHICRGAP